MLSGICNEKAILTVVVFAVSIIHSNLNSPQENQGP